MNNHLDEKIDLLKKLNTDDSRFIVNVYESYQKYQKNLENKIKCTSIILKSEFSKATPNVIDLDLLYCKPYFHTRMRVHLNCIIEKLIKTDLSKITRTPSNFCKKTVFYKPSKITNTISEDQIDITDFIKILKEKKSKNKNNYNSGFIFIAEKIDEESLFKEEQLKKAIEIMNIETEDKQFERIYNEVYSCLQEDFVSNNYCDFIHNKCVMQRRLRTYPINNKNGCCFTRIRTCPHLQKDGSCNVECMACRLFSCKYLCQRGIAYYANEFVLLKAFLTKKQRKHLVFDFFKPKSKVLEKVLKS